MTSRLPRLPALAVAAPLTSLPPAAARLRAVHALIAVVQMGSLTYVWACALSGRRGPLLNGAITALAAQGVALLIGHGDCPLGPLQRRLGDPTPLFELVLSPRSARRAVPLLAILAAVGILQVVWPGKRQPGRGALRRPVRLRSRPPQTTGAAHLAR